MTALTFTCRCTWRDIDCPNLATAEDGLCNWCASLGARTDAQIATDPKAVITPEGEVLGISGAGQVHDGTSDRPGACWYSDSGRTIRPLLAPREGGAA